MPGIPLFFTDTGATPDLIYHPLPGLYLGDDTFLGEGIWLDEGISEAFADAPFLVEEGVVIQVTPVPAEAFMPVPTLPVGDVVETVTPVPAVAFMPVPGIAGQDVILPVSPVPAVAFMPVPQTSGGLSIILIPSVRELPPLRLSHLIETPSGRFFRWGADEPNPANVPSGERFSDTMPGGFETSDATLPRQVGQDTPDLERLSTWTIHGAGGEVVWEGRLERAPRTSGDQVSVSPSGVGFQAALDDDKSATLLGVDIDLSRWGSPGTQRRLNIASAFGFSDASTTSDDTTGQPALRTSFTGSWGAAPGLPLSEAWYDAGPGSRVGVVYYAWKNGGNVTGTDPNWIWRVYLADTDADTAPGQDTGSLTAVGPGQGSISASTTSRRYAVVQLLYLQPSGADGVEYGIAWTSLAVFGDHGLPRYGTPSATSAPGVLASDVVKHAVGRWAPQLNVTSTSVQASSFVIPHLSFLEPTTASEIVKGASRFGLQDWAVWDDRTFWWHDRGAQGRNWRTRVGPAQLEETGPQADRVYESTVVQYQDVTGAAKTVGPPGSRADVEDPALKDTDPENPANKASITRRALLTMGTSTVAGAIEIGRRFLVEQKQLDSSGRCRVVGHVESQTGVLFPYWAVRAGDSITFVDAADNSARRVVRTEKDHGSRTCNIDLDAPPQGLEQLLARLGVSLVPLGFS